MEVNVNKMTSAVTQLPYSYYFLPFCKPGDLTEKSENLGEILKVCWFDTLPE